MDYYSAIKKNEIFPLATTWMELEGIMPSEISQSGKGKYYTISLVCGYKQMNIREGKQN